MNNRWLKEKAPRRPFWGEKQEQLASQLTHHLETPILCVMTPRREGLHLAKPDLRAGAGVQPLLAPQTASPHPIPTCVGIIALNDTDACSHLLQPTYQLDGTRGYTEKPSEMKDSPGRVTSDNRDSYSQISVIPQTLTLCSLCISSLILPNPLRGPIVYFPFMDGKTSGGSVPCPRSQLSWEVCWLFLRTSLAFIVHTPLSLLSPSSAA